MPKPNTKLKQFALESLRNRVEIMMKIMADMPTGKEMGIMEHESVEVMNNLRRWQDRITHELLSLETDALIDPNQDRYFVAHEATYDDVSWFLIQMNEIPRPANLDAYQTLIHDETTRAAAKVTYLKERYRVIVRKAGQVAS